MDEKSKSHLTAGSRVSVFRLKKIQSLFEEMF